MLLSNLKEPTWIPVSCDHRLIHFAVCLEKNQTSGLMKIKKHYCQIKLLEINQNCYGFLWVTYKNSSLDWCKNLQAVDVSINEFKSFDQIFQAVSSISTFPTFITGTSIISVYKFFKKVILDKVFVQQPKTDGFHICKFNKISIIIGTNLFPCQLGGYILQKYVCDGRKDCPNDNTDEQGCICNDILNVIIQNFTCKFLTSLKRNNATCGPNYYLTITGHCEKYLEFSTDYTHYKDLSMKKLYLQEWH